MKVKTRMMSGFFFERGPRHIRTSALAKSKVTISDVANMFTGIIAPHQQMFDGENADGLLQDKGGFSFIYAWEESESRISFIKRYRHRSVNDIITCNFTKKNNQWLGSWSEASGGSGVASCSFVIIDDTFRTQEAIKGLLS